MRGNQTMKKTCFVVMPFSQTNDRHTEAYWTSFFSIIKRVMEQLGYDSRRSEVGPYKLFTNIVNRIESSDLVIAVLTDFNANVWYELGIRHTLRNSTVMLLQQGQKAPFDISDYGIIFYEDSINLEQELKVKIADYLNNSNPHFSDSPVLTALDSKKITQIENEKNEYKSLLDSLRDILNEHQNSSSAQTARKNILWINDFSKSYGLTKHILQDKSVSFDVRYSFEEALDLYKNNKYVAVVVDVGTGEEIEDALSFVNEIKLLGQRAYFIFFGDLPTIRKYGNKFMQIGAPAISNIATNVIALLNDVINDTVK